MMAETFRFEAGGTESQRRMLYEQLNQRNLFDPANVDRDRQLLDEFGPWEQYSAPAETVQPSAPVAEENQYINWAMDAFPDPTQEEYDKAAGQIARKEQFLDRGFDRSETIGINRLNRMLGPDLMEEETTVETPEVDSNLTAVAQKTTLPPRPDEPGKLEQIVFDSKTTEGKKEEERLKDPKPEPDPMQDVEIVEEEVVEEPGSMPVDMKQTDGYLEGKNIVSISDPYGYGLETYDGVIDKLMELQDIYEGDEFTEGSFYFFETEKQNYVNLANDIKNEIDTYEDSINAIAEEKPGPAITGANKFWAVIAAALGAGAASITGTPNFALQIINKTIDDHLAKFKDDRDFRQKSAERQQLNLIQERGRMLQLAQNASDSALASLKNRAAVESQIATVEGIKSGIVEARERGDQQMVLALQKMMYQRYTADLEAKKAYGEKFVPALELKDSEGNTIMFSPFGATTVKEAAKLRDYYSIMSNASDIIDKLEPLLERSLAEKLAPAVFSQTRKDILFWTAELEKEFKNLAGFGANYAEREILLNQATLPSVMDNTYSNLIIGAKRAIGPFREKVIKAYQNKIKPHGGTILNPNQNTIRKQMPNAEDLGGSVRNAGG
jgi:hypothetical protein